MDGWMDGRLDGLDGGMVKFLMYCKRMTLGFVFYLAFFLVKISFRYIKYFYNGNLAFQHSLLKNC